MISLRRKTKSAFTIIEISIVIAIIGGMLALAFAGFRFLERTRVSATKQKLAQMDATLESYRTEIGEYPQDLNELVTGPQNPKLTRKFSGALVKEDEMRDAWGRDFVYSRGSKGAQPPYDLYSTGPKGETKIFSPVSAEQ